MKQLSGAEKTRFEELLIKAIDGELSEEEQREFDVFLENNPACLQEWQAHTKIKEVTKMMNFKKPNAEVWDSYWLNVYNRLERGIAWIAISAGTAIFLAYGLYYLVDGLFAFFASPEIPFFIKLAVLLVIGGVSVLLVSVLREKLILQKKDPYKEVQR